MILKNTLALAAASMLMVAPAFAQAPASPTGKSDTKTSGQMKPDSDSTGVNAGVSTGRSDSMSTGNSMGTDHSTGAAGVSGSNPSSSGSATTR
jgi:hypothetical protein